MSEVLLYVPTSPPPPAWPNANENSASTTAPPPPRLKLSPDPLSQTRFGGSASPTTPTPIPSASSPTAATPTEEGENITQPPNILLIKGNSQTNSSGGGGTPTGGPLSPTSGTAPEFPSQPCLLAGKYLVTKAVDSSTSEAIDLNTHANLLVKSLPSRTARDVCAQHALLGDQEGIRPPLELVQGSEGQSWLVIAPHYGDLHSYVRMRRRIREGEAQRLFSQVVKVVELCHDAGLVLRDLKLRKFVFTDAHRRTVSLESLEDSVVSGGEDVLEDKHGCPAYVAPEILRTAAYSGRAADMWSLGVMLYTMLVGRYPFHGCHTNALFLKIRSGDFLVPDWVSSRARHLIQLLLQRDPTARPTATKVLSHPWLTRPPRDLPPRDFADHRVPDMTPPETGSPHSRMNDYSGRHRQPLVYYGI